MLPPATQDPAAVLPQVPPRLPEGAINPIAWSVLHVSELKILLFHRARILQHICTGHTLDHLLDIVKHGSAQFGGI